MDFMEPKERLTKMMEAENEALQKLEAELRTLNARLGAFRDSLQAFEPGAENGAAAGVSRRLQDKLKKEQGTIEDLEAKIVDAKGRVSAFEEALRLFPREGEEVELRAGSQLADVRRVLREKGTPLTLAEILVAIGKATDDVKVRNSLRGSLAKYAQDGRVFTKEEAPDTFGLIAFRSDTANKG
jgi:uncharacterized protein YhaN